MLNSAHPADERLAALGARDADAVDDPALRDHVDGCSRCAALADEISALRAALADLPDVAPHRPLRLLPPVEPAPEPRDSLGTWARRLFAPVLTAGAALALVGTVGTAMPAMQQSASGGAADGAALEAQTAASAGTGAAGAEEFAPFATEDPDGISDEGGGTTLQATAPPDARDAAADEFVADGGPLPAERSPWPMVLFTGVALMVGAATVRWILAGRPG
jgi:hypothetical protein